MPLTQTSFFFLTISEAVVEGREYLSLGGGPRQSKLNYNCEKVKVEPISPRLTVLVRVVFPGMDCMNEIGACSTVTELHRIFVIGGTLQGMKGLAENISCGSLARSSCMI